MDQLGRVVNATGEKWKAMQSPPREREPPRKETCLNDDFQGSPELPPRRPSVVGSYVKDVDHDDDSTDEESKDASSQDESKDASDQDESSDDQPDKRRKF
jgi:hypothetical protein